MVMATSSDPYLHSTNVVEDAHNHDDVIGVRFSYIYYECFFTIHILADPPQTAQLSQTADSDHRFLRDLISRFNEAGVWTEQDKSIEDVDKRLDVVWQDAEDLVRATAFEKVRMLGRKHGHTRSSDDSYGWSRRNLADYLLPKAFNLQLVVESEGFDVICRVDLSPCLPFVTETCIPSQPGLISIKPHDVHILKRYRAYVLKVQTEKGIFYCKLNNAGSQDSFLREFKTLQRIQDSVFNNDIRVPRLRGVVEAEGGVIGLLLDLIEAEDLDLSAVLRQRNDIQDCVRQRWAQQISKTLKCIHAIGLVWGDAKTANVLIDKRHDAWLVNFGGGFTSGWIDEARYDTQAGDLQGLENTLLDIFGKR